MKTADATFPKQLLGKSQAMLPSLGHLLVCFDPTAKALCFAAVGLFSSIAKTLKKLKVDRQG